MWVCIYINSINNINSTNSLICKMYIFVQYRPMKIRWIQNAFYWLVISVSIYVKMYNQNSL